MSNFSVEASGAWGTDEVRLTSNASISITNTDSYIIAGWFKPTAATGGFTPVLGKAGGGLIPPGSSVSYYFVYDGGTGLLQFRAKINSTSEAAAIGSNYAFGTKLFVVGWVDASAQSLNLQVDNGSISTNNVSLTSFSDPGNDFFLGTRSDLTGSKISGLWDEWFFCKNPSSLSSALSIVSDIYSQRLTYSSLTSTQKTDLGLVSWWTMDDSSGNLLDSHSTNDLVVTSSGVINYAEPTLLIDHFIDLNDSITPSDDLSKEIGKNLNDIIFENDNVQTSPLLAPLDDEIKLADWISIKRNPPRSEWTS